ncbi:MAG: endo-1,4-beta-xylanase [Gammaproteobacteria bacterium]|nr:MAG: endo-1,4-beta-xylanase [Gammaproteobacteria bacterium]
MCKINLIPLLALSLLVSACGGGGGSSSPKPKSSVAKVSSSSKVSSSVTSSSITPSSSAPASATSSAAISSISSSSVYSANVNHLRDLATFPIGVAVSNTDSPSFNILTNASEQAVAEKHFSEMTAGNIMKVKSLHPFNNGNASDFTFTNADAFVEYAKSNNMTVHGHTLIWHSGYQVPEFIKTWNGTSSNFLTMIEAHVTTIVDHFGASGAVKSWDVVNEALNDGVGNPAVFGFRTDSAFYTKSGNSAEYIEVAFKAARLADPTATLFYNDYNIDQNNSKTTKLIEMITDFQAREIPIDGIGFQMHVFMNYPSIDDIKSAMQKVVEKGLKVKITELDVSVNNPYSNWPDSKISTFTESVALDQKKRYCEIVAAYLEVVPEDKRAGITVWGTTDANSWLDGPEGLYKNQFNNEKIAWPLLFDNQYNDKPALRGFADGLTETACTNL